MVIWLNYIFFFLRVFLPSSPLAFHPPKKSNHHFLWFFYTLQNISGCLIWFWFIIHNINLDIKFDLGVGLFNHHCRCCDHVCAPYWPFDFSDFTMKCITINHVIWIWTREFLRHWKKSISINWRIKRSFIIDVFHHQ